jgi:hypothetical protein
MLLYVPEDSQDDVREEMSGRLQVPFKFESRGSETIFFDPEQDYSEAEAFRSTQDIQGFRELADLERKKTAGQ